MINMLNIYNLEDRVYSDILRCKSTNAAETLIRAKEWDVQLEILHNVFM